MKKHLLVLIVVLLSLTACSKNPVSVVKNGVLEFDKSVTVGDAFSGYKYFSDSTWKTIKTEQNRTIVEFRAKVPIEQYKDAQVGITDTVLSSDLYNQVAVLISKVVFVAQFVIDKDNKTFNLEYSGYELYLTNGTQTEQDSYNALAPIHNIYINKRDDLLISTIYNIAKNLNSAKEQELADAKLEKVKVLESEAQTNAELLWPKFITKCVDYYAWKRESLYQSKGKVSVEMSNGDIPEPPTKAEILNGAKPSSIEWRAKGSLTFEASRVRYYSNWGEWGEHQKVYFEIIKENNTWKMIPTDFTMGDCSQY